MALVATSADDLQRMFVNVKKTKVMVFHKCSSAVRSKAEKDRLDRLHETIHNQYYFSYKDRQVDIVREFKYLGLIYNEKIEHLHRPTWGNIPPIYAACRFKMKPERKTCLNS